MSLLGGAGHTKVAALIAASVAFTGCGIFDSGDHVTVTGRVTYEGEPEADAFISLAFSLGGCGLSGCSSREALGATRANDNGDFEDTFSHDRGCGQGITVVTRVQGYEVARSIGGCGQQRADFTCTASTLPIPGQSLWDQCR